MATSAIDLGSVGETGGAQSAEFSAESSATSEPGSEGTDDHQGRPAEAQGSQAEEQVDGRRGPANIRNSIKAASEAIPEQAQAFKELGNAYFREQAYKAAFPTPQEAVGAKTLIESAGGLDGIAKLQSAAQSYETQDSLLREGNPEVLEAFSRDFPEGFAALAGPYLERLHQVNREAAAAAVAPYALGMLENAGFGNFLSDVIKESDPARAKNMVQQLAQWYEQQRSDIQKMKQTVQKNPQADQLQQQKTQLQQEREQIFQERVTEQVNGRVKPEISRTVDQYGKDYKLSETQKAHFQEAMQNRILKEMATDKTYLGQLTLRKSNKGRTAESLSSYIASEFNGRIKDAAFATYAAGRDLYGGAKQAGTSTTGVVKAGTPKAAPDGGPLFVSQQPPDTQIDWNKPSADKAQLNFIMGRGYTKDGRFITWRK